MAEDYQLLGSINDRKQPIRCLAFNNRGRDPCKLLSGDLEGAAIIYNNFTLEHKLQTGCPLYSCTWQGPNKFFLGDGLGNVSIYEYKHEVATLIKKVKVSNRIISGLSVEGKFVACGCWDGYVYCYDATMDKLLWKTNRNLRYAVCVRLCNDIVYTGSQAGIISGFDAMTGLLKCQKESAHEDIIRHIHKGEDFEGKTWLVSCSNDAMVNFWHPTLQECSTTSANETGSFCFDVCPIDGDHAVTASDDGSICLIQPSTHSVHQIIQLECTAWCLARTDNLIVVVGTDSGELLLLGDDVAARAIPDGIRFTREARESRLASIVAHMTQKAKQQEAENAQDFSKLPPVSDLHLHPGRKVGQTSLFTEAGEVKVFQWTGKEWVYIGEMMGGANKSGASTIGEASKIYEGDEFFPAGRYDFVFDVEIDQRPGDAPRLPYNVGQNTLDVAERFCALHNLPKSNVQDIVAFIKKNTPDGSTVQRPRAQAPTTGDGKESTSKQPPPPSQIMSIECTAQMIIFNTPAKWGVVIDKIREIDSSYGSKIQELAILSSVQTSVSRPNFLKDASVKMSEVHFLFDWPNEHFGTWPDPYPILDLCRFYILNSDAIQKIRQHNMVVNILQFVTTMIRKKAVNSTMMGLRLLTNMLSVQSLREHVLNTIELILRTVLDEGSLTTKPSETALMSLCHNTALALRLDQRVGQVDIQRKSDLKAIIRLMMSRVAASSSISTLRQEIEKLL